MKDEEYNKHPGLNYSGAKLILRSPLHYVTKLNEPEDEEENKALQIGTLTHLAALQPKLFEMSVKVIPECDRRTKDGKAIYEAFTAGLSPTDTAVKKEDYDLINSMGLAAREAIKRLVPDDATTTVEQAFYGQYKGKDIKGRPDMVVQLASGERIIIDLKTTQDAKGFKRDVASFMYYLQAPWYMQLTGAKKFYFVALEKKEPFDYAIYELDEEALAFGKLQMDLALDIWSNCVKFQSYPGYPKEPQLISLPKYAFEPNS